MMQLGLALSSGGAATMAQVGVIEELRAAGLHFDCVAGTSGGAIVGAAFCAGQLEAMTQAMLGLSRRRVIWLFDPTWPRLGMLEGRRGLDFVRPYLGDRLEALRPRFAAVALDLDSGLEVDLCEGPAPEAVRASAALPGILTPVHWDGRTLIDGGIVNPIPVSVTRDLGASFVLAINVLPLAEEVYRVLRRRARNDLPLTSQLLTRLPIRLPAPVAPPAPPDGVGLHAAAEADERSESLDEHERRGLVDIVSRAAHIAQCQVAGWRLQHEPPEFLLTVPVPEIGVFDYHRSAELIEAGRKAAQAALPRIRAAVRRARPLRERLAHWLGRGAGADPPRDPDAPQGRAAARAGRGRSRSGRSRSPR